MSGTNKAGQSSQQLATAMERYDATTTTCLTMIEKAHGLFGEAVHELHKWYEKEYQNMHAEIAYVHRWLDDQGVGQGELSIRLVNATGQWSSAQIGQHDAQAESEKLRETLKDVARACVGAMAYPGVESINLSWVEETCMATAEGRKPEYQKTTPAYVDKDRYVAKAELEVLRTVLARVTGSFAQDPVAIIEPGEGFADQPGFLPSCIDELIGKYKASLAEVEKLRNTERA